jgi:hypothetical protein
MVMLNRNFLGKLCFGLGLCGFLLATVDVPQVPNAARAIQYRDGTTAFSYPPRLTHARTTRNLVSENNPTYYISFSFPAAAEEPLDKVVISLDEGRRDPLFGYQLEAARAIASTPQGDEVLSLGMITQDDDTKTLTIQFDPPVPPGNPITLALKPTRNPRYEGVYLFGINAFPVGVAPEPTFVGYARLSFYRPSRGIWR